MSEYPGSPGWKEPTTSREAAEKMENSAVPLRAIVYACLFCAELTADEVAERLGLSVLSIRPRLSELRAADRIEPTGKRRKNESGMSAHVWRVKRRENGS